MFNQLPHYRCHKIVAAALILSIAAAMPAHSESNANASGDQAFRDSVLTLVIPKPGQEDPLAAECIEHSVDADWMARHKPAAGGYFVAYEDGYTSYSPAAPFDGGYTLLSIAEAEEDAKLAEIIASVRADERQLVLRELEAKLPDAVAEKLAAGAAAQHAERPTKHLPFFAALERLQEGQRVARADWHGDAWLKRVDDELADMISFQFSALKPQAWIGQKTPRGQFTPWAPTQADMQASDWFVVFPA